MKKLIITFILTIVLIGCTTDNTAIKEQKMLESKIAVLLENAKSYTNATNLENSIIELEELILELDDGEYKESLVLELEELKTQATELKQAHTTTMETAQADIKAKAEEIAKVKAEEEAKALAEAKAKEAKKSTASTSKKSSTNSSKTTISNSSKNYTYLIGNSGMLLNTEAEAIAWAENYADNNIRTIEGYLGYSTGDKWSIEFSYY